ncbi:MAG: septation protein SepH [Micrococcales bacterium]|nr:septation protein SepH [Micrococcales bacterium]MCL2668075.1 septation protein SepH [Micrococcales bacterium]
MGELELVGLDPDGENLVLHDEDGVEFTLPIDEALRSALRRDRPRFQPPPPSTDPPGPLTPREIQARIRAGETSAEIAASADVPLQHVRRFEGPALADREYIAIQARSAPVGRETDAPPLGDLVADRLAARGVEVSSLTWDAIRDRSGPWIVLARFTAAGQPLEARWTFDPTTKTLTATEDEARWLSETEIAEPPVRRHLTAVRTPAVYDLVEATTEATDTAALLDELGSRRGKRQSIDLDSFFDAEEPPPPPKTTRRTKTPTNPTRKTPTGSTRATTGATRTTTGPTKTTSPTSTATGPTKTTTGPTRAASGSTKPAAKAPAKPSTQPTPSPSPQSRASQSTDATSQRTKTATTSTSATSATAPTPTRTRRKGRAKVPSWEEIVFGARPE